MSKKLLLNLWNISGPLVIGINLLICYLIKGEIDIKFMAPYIAISYLLIAGIVFLLEKKNKNTQNDSPN